LSSAEVSRATVADASANAAGAPAGLYFHAIVPGQRTGASNVNRNLSSRCPAGASASSTTWSGASAAPTGAAPAKASAARTARTSGGKHRTGMARRVMTTA
jgi:hypothetical protein